jgi:Flp pilus assembly protein TadG
MAALIVVVIGLLALSLDLGYISLVRGQMQSAADAAALASTSQLLDPEWLAGGTSQDLSGAYLQGDKFATLNAAGGVSLKLGTSDVKYGYIADPKDPTSPFDTTHTPYNSAQVKVQRTNTRNGELGLFFAKIFNRGSLPLEATATATYEGNVTGFKFNDNYADEMCLLLPFTLKCTDWERVCKGIGPDDWTCGPRGGAVSHGPDTRHEIKLFPTKNMTPGNFGTWDIGSDSNSSSDIERQILCGPSKEDLALMGGSVELGTTGTLDVTGDTGISAGFKDALKEIEGDARIIAIHDEVAGNGDNSVFTICGFVGCTIVDVDLTGTKKELVIQPCFAVNSHTVTGENGSHSTFVYKPLRLTR